MAREIQLPCGGDGVCMRCKVKPPTEESLSCNTCATPWHVSCLSSPPDSLNSTLQWQCPDCSGDPDPVPDSGIAGFESGDSVLLSGIRAIEADKSLTEAQKAKKRQQLMTGKAPEAAVANDVGDDDEVLAALRENFSCSICMKLLERPVTTSCGHNFCLKCFEKWIGQGKSSCAKCRCPIPKKMTSKPPINYMLVASIRQAIKSATLPTHKVKHYISNDDRPDKPLPTERAVLSGNANAADGKCFVTVPHDHFGPITAEHDPTRQQGVLVGETWTGRPVCKQWGAHREHVAGIAGQSKHGAQSVALSGGYGDDEDHGEWFIYTGSGGRDLSGNRRTNRVQTSDQIFSKGNEALRLSCKMGYPVRVIRTWKEKRGSYAPNDGVRYDGIYRIEKCWRKIGEQGVYLVCRYLFVRCDNEAAPWTCGGGGDRPRPLPDVPELEQAIDLFVREDSPAWDFDEAEGRWKWMKPPPASKKVYNASGRGKRQMTTMAARAKLLKEFSCQICRKVMSLPVTTPCAHNFCKTCIEAKFAGIARMRERGRGGRTLRAQKNVMKCPCCPNDLSDFLQNPQVNTEVMDLIEKLQKIEEKPAGEDEASTSSENITESEDAGEEDEDAGEEDEDEGAGEEEEEPQVVVSEAEPPMKKVKLDDH